MTESTLGTTVRRQVPFGLRSDGRLIDAGQAVRGLACSCTCPGCGATLIANRGAVKAAYFSHHSTEGCATGAESALHLAAKQILLDRLEVMLPAQRVEVRRHDPEFGWFEVHQDIAPSNMGSFMSARPEVFLEGRRPDVLATNHDGSHLAIEVMVTHAVDEDKANALRQSGRTCIEIDLRTLIGVVLSMDALARDVVDDTSNKRWICHPAFAAVEARLLAGFSAWRSSKQVERDRFRRQEAEHIERLHWELADKSRKGEQIAERNRAYRALPAQRKRTILIDALGLEGKPWPRHLAVNLRADMGAILAEKELWQGALFVRFIHDADIGSQLPEILRLTKWVEQRFGLRPLSLGSAQAAVQAYLGYLIKCGYLLRRGPSLQVAYAGLHPPSVPNSSMRLERSWKPRALPASLPLQPPSGEDTVTSNRLKWAHIWPDSGRLRSWLFEFAAAVDRRMDVDKFLLNLLGSEVELTEDDMQDLLVYCDCDPIHLAGLLRNCALSADTWRVVSAGEPPPWSSR